MFENKKVIAGIAVCVVCFIGIILILRPAKETKENVTAVQNLVVDAGATTEKDNGSSVPEALRDRNVFFSGMNDIVADKDTVVQLENVAENEDILISYTILNNSTGEELFKTDYIPAGMHVDWRPSDSLDKGTYEICYAQAPVWQSEDGKVYPLTNANNVASLTLN